MKVSLIIASYNPQMDWLFKAMASAAGMFDEIIIVDDGSDPPIPWATIRQRHAGVDVARNAGIAAASGDVIAQIDDDDLFIAPNVPHFRNFVENNDSDVWHFPIALFGDVTGIVCNTPVDTGILDRDNIPGVSWFRKSLWSDLGGYRRHVGEDWDLWARAYTVGKRFTYYPAVFYLHRVHGNSAVHRHHLDDDAVWLKMRDEIRASCANPRSSHEGVHLYRNA